MWWSISNLFSLRGIIIHSFITCKLNHKQSGESPPTGVEKYPRNVLKGVNKVTILLFPRARRFLLYIRIASEKKTYWNVKNSDTLQLKRQQKSAGHTVGL